MMVRDFQSVIGSETKQQCLRTVRPAAGRGGGVRRRRVRTRRACSTRSWTTPAWNWSASKPAAAAPKLGGHAATLSFGKPGVLHGSFSYVLQDDDGQTADVHSVSAGLDYPGVGPEHSYWHDASRVRYCSVTDDEALDAFHLCGRLEGILPALETAHAVVEAMRVAAKRPKDDVVVLCFSGRGDKDCAEVARRDEEVILVKYPPVTPLFLFRVKR